MVELLAPRPDESILDLGCGTGELASVVAATGASVVGIEADEAMIAKARRDHPGVRFEVADGHRFEVTEPFDAVMSNAALQWMRDPDAVIARVHAARLEAGGFRVRSLELIDRPTPLGPDGLGGMAPDVRRSHPRRRTARVSRIAGRKLGRDIVGRAGGTSARR